LKVKFKIKVVDPSFNFDLPESDGIKRYLHVSIFTKTFAEAPTIQNIGDIIYLKRFYVFYF
jgi:hypothetical protein